MADELGAEPDQTAVRVALWRVMHVLADAPPHVLEDEIGLRLAGPADGWRDRPDMDPVFTSAFRASIVARARFIEDLVAERAEHGTGQYVLLGAGLDTFAQRRPDLAARLRVFEVDQPGTQAWKRQRLIELGYGIPEWYVAPDETLDVLLAALDAQAGRSQTVIAAHDLDEAGKPGERWAGEPPATLERVLFHVLQEYARHLGHLDLACELAGGPTGE